MSCLTVPATHVATWASILILTVSMASQATTIAVPDDQPTIQAGIDVATAGDTVLVAPGTYMGDGNRDIDFGGRTIVVRSENGPGATTINCEATPAEPHRGFYFHNAENFSAILEGFTITNGRATQATDYKGGGILCQNAGPTIMNCVISNCWADGGSGGGIALLGSQADVTDCVISGNRTNNWGGGILCDEGTVAIIRGCTIELNYGEGGGMAIGLTADDDSAPIIENCTIVGNADTSPADVGGVWIGNLSIPIFTYCVFTGNQAGSGIGGGAIRIQDSAHATFRYCTISGNTTTNVGGGILIASTTGGIILDQSVLWGNCADTGGNEVYQSNPGAQITISCSVVDQTGIDPAVNVVYVGENVFADPLFCEPMACDAAPTTDGSYSVAANSPALAANNPCGVLLGAIGEGCEAQVPILPVSWGQVKSRFDGK